MSSHPPAPWRMRGPAVIVVAPIPAATARALLPPGVRPLVIAGRGLGVALIADYRQGSPLQYGETAGLVATVSPRIGGFVDTMLVDLEASRAGGREMWNVPKEMARFTWHGDPPGAVEVHDAEGSLVIAARWHPVHRPRLGLAGVADALAGGGR